MTQRTHDTKPNILPTNLPAEGFVRLNRLVGPGNPLPISKSTLWAAVRAGKFPAPCKIGGMAMWRVEDVRAFIKHVEGGEA